MSPSTHPDGTKLSFRERFWTCSAANYHVSKEREATRQQSEKPASSRSSQYTTSTSSTSTAAYVPTHAAADAAHLVSPLRLPRGTDFGAFMRESRRRELVLENQRRSCYENVSRGVVAPEGSVGEGFAKRVKEYIKPTWE